MTCCMRRLASSAGLIFEFMWNECSQRNHHRTKLMDRILPEPHNKVNGTSEERGYANLYGSRCPRKAVTDSTPGNALDASASSLLKRSVRSMADQCAALPYEICVRKTEVTVRARMDCNAHRCHVRFVRVGIFGSGSDYSTLESNRALASTN